jgi:hypothetical protein
VTGSLRRWSWPMALATPRSFSSGALAPGLVAVAGGGEVGGAEGQVPQPVVVVLGAAQVQGEGLVEQAEAGEGFFQPVDGLGSGREDLVQSIFSIALASERHICHLNKNQGIMY